MRVLVKVFKNYCNVTWYFSSAQNVFFKKRYPLVGYYFTIVGNSTIKCGSTFYKSTVENGRLEIPTKYCSNYTKLPVPL